MNEWGIRSVLAAGALLLGSIPFGLLVSKAYGVGNLRNHGSGNIGATNVSRVAGFWPAGFLTFFLDALKGVLLILPLAYGWVSIGLANAPAFYWALGLLSVVGHCFSPWLGFKGGKGVATIFGVVFALAPVCGAIGGVVYAFAALATGVGAAGSLLGLLSMLAIYRLAHPADGAFLVFIAMVSLAIYRHEENLDRMLAREE